MHLLSSRFYSLYILYSAYIYIYIYREREREREREKEREGGGYSTLTSCDYFFLRVFKGDDARLTNSVSRDGPLFVVLFRLVPN